jgi:iron-sulfur cluster assembly protein
VPEAAALERKPVVLTLTDNAREAIHALTDEGPPSCGVRIATAASSTNGASPAVSLAIAPAPEADDEVLDDDGARVFLQPAAAQMLGEQTLDAQVDHRAQQVEFFVC